MSEAHRQPDDGPQPLPELTAEQQRVLGSLLEKEVTVPASYPMSVNAVRTACNQTSSREPVVDFDERLVHDVLRALKDQGLVVVTWSDSGRRTMKYAQRLVAQLDLSAPQRALLTVLLLRGAQPAGALRSRTERLHPFTDRDEVAAELAGLAAHEPPLVRELPRQPREQDARWIHLLGPVALPEQSGSLAASPGAGGAVLPPPGASTDRAVVLAAGAEARDAQVRTSYAAVAADYADRLGDELDDLPFERWLLDRVVDHAVGPDGGPVVEVGCGPGHVTAYLAHAGVEASGLDLTPEMVAEARRRHPDVDYQVGDLRRLMKPVAADGWAAVLGWYSLIHLADAELPAAVAALVRTLRPGGWLVLGMHGGTFVRQVDDWFGHEVDVLILQHRRAALVALLEGAGLVEVESYERGAMTSRGEQTDRVYVVGRLPTP